MTHEDFDYSKWNNNDPKTFKYAAFNPAKNIVKMKVMKQYLLTKPQKILICAPSNLAADNILRAFIEHGILNADGDKIPAKVLRIGHNYHPSLTEYSIDYQKKIQGAKSDRIHNILESYRIFIGTLASAGLQILQKNKLIFDTVIIDEAGQSVEIAALIPLRYRKRYQGIRVLVSYLV